MTAQHIAAHIACIGECMIELSAAGEGLFRQFFAGDTLNTAVYLARSLQDTGHRVQYITAVGQDGMSDDMIEFWRSENIDCSLVARIEDKHPGLYAIEVDEQGERSFSYWRSDSAAKQMFTGKGLNQEQLTAIASEADYLYLSGITLAILDEQSRTTLLSLLLQARSKGAKVVFDSNYRPRLWPSPEVARNIYGKILEITDIALVTFDDEQMLFGDQFPDETLKRLGAVEEIVVKNGSGGCLVKSSGKAQLVPSTLVEKVVDTTSAGDSFNGAYLAARMKGVDPMTAAEAGHQMAGTVIQYAGAIIPKEVTANLTSPAPG
ncbi:MAG: sugar kinase [Endozoicomonas sp.]